MNLPSNVSSHLLVKTNSSNGTPPNPIRYDEVIANNSSNNSIYSEMFKIWRPVAPRWLW